MTADHIDRTAWAISRRLCLHGHAICSPEEMQLEARYHIVRAIQRGMGTPYRRAYWDTLRWLKRTTGRRKDGTPKEYQQVQAYVGGTWPVSDTSDSTGDMTLHDHERTMRRLPERERTVLQARLDGLYQWQIGHHLGVTEARVCQIERAARERYRRLAAA